MHWYYAVNQEQKGPVSEEEFQALVAAGTVQPETLVWRDGMSDWAAYGTLTGAAPAAAAPAAAPGASELRTCSECHRQFRAEDMVSYQGRMICAECKPAFFQRVQEGATGFGGNTPNAELMARARAKLAGLWGLAIGVVVVYYLIAMAASFVPILSSIVPLIITGPFSVGLAIFFLAIVRGTQPQFGMLFEGFKPFGTALAAYLLMTIFILLWCLLLIVPGIIAAFSYSMTFYIIADNPEIGPLEAIRKSKEMMRGMKWKYFCLSFRFIGWSLLCLLTLCIGYLWLMPYMMTSMAEFYEDLKKA